MSNTGVITVTCGNVLLADGSDSGGRVVMKDAQGYGEVQIVEFFRAAQINLFDRGNKRNEVPVMIQQTHSTVYAALQQYFQGSDKLPTGDTFPNVAVWTFGWVDYDGTQFTAYFSAEAKITKEFIGVTTRTTYNLTGGTFTVSTSGGTTLIFAGTAANPGPDHMVCGSASFTPANLAFCGTASSV